MEQTMISIGQEVAVVQLHRLATHTVHFGYTVTKVTPTGQITITSQDGHKHRFDKNGYEMGAPSSYSRKMIRFDVDALQEQEYHKKRAIDEAQAINDIDKPNNVNHHYSKEVIYAELDALQRQIDEARKVVDLILRSWV
jgi:hypothetical protein